jgi:hypothetical protein
MRASSVHATIGMPKRHARVYRGGRASIVSISNPFPHSKTSFMLDKWMLLSDTPELTALCARAATRASMDPHAHQGEVYLTRRCGKTKYCNNCTTPKRKYLQQILKQIELTEARVRLWQMCDLEVSLHQPMGTLQVGKRRWANLSSQLDTSLL